MKYLANIILLTFFLSCRSPDQQMQASIDTVSTASGHPKVDSLLNANAYHSGKRDDTIHKKPLKIAKQSRQEEIIIETEISSVEDYYQAPPAVVTKKYVIINEKIVFTYNHHQPETRGIGCSGGNTLFSFEIADSLQHFSVRDEAINYLNLRYQTTGGLWSEEAANVKSGLISGTLLADATWDLRVNVVLFTENILNEKSEYTYKMDGIFTR